MNVPLLPDSTGEVQGRNRELRRLTEPASSSTREIFSEFIDVLGQLQLHGQSASKVSRYEDLLSELQVRSQNACAESEAEMQHLLRVTSRRRATELARSRSLPEGPAYARMTWVLGVAGVDDDGDSGSLDTYLHGASKWYAESLIRMIAHPSESSLLAIAPAARHTRMEFGSTSFRWVCELFARAIDVWADSEGGDCARLFGGGRTIALSDAIGRNLPLPDQSVLASVHPSVLDAMTARPRPATAFAQLIESNGPETEPLFGVGSEVFIGNASALVFRLETVLMSAVQRVLGSEAQGDAFEFACHYIAESLLPPSVHVYRDSFVSDTLTASDGDEVDLHLHAKGMEVIIEAKSYIPTGSAESAAASYDQLLKANKQVERRVTRIRKGKWIRRKRAKNGDHVSGLVVSLHDYTGQTWRPESMLESGGETFVAMPLQAFAMSMGCMRAAEDLVQFLEVRSAIGRLSISGGDELETLLGWMSGWRPETLPHEAGARVQVRPRSIHTDELLGAQWGGPDGWREYLFRVSKAIHA